mgnify:FL=1
MTKVYKVIAYLNANGKTYESERSNFELTHENGVDSISLWNVEGLTQPTNEQLDALESEADTVKTNSENSSSQRTTLKASARQKLMDGEPLTEDEAKTIVL